MRHMEMDSLNPESTYHVLIVEDDLCLESIFERVLHSVDRNVSYTWATSVEEAELILKERRVSLIIADFGLEGRQTGMDLWDRLEELAPSVPFLMVSGLGVERFLAMVGDARICPPFLPKPFRATECRQIVKTLLDRRRA